MKINYREIGIRANENKIAIGARWKKRFEKSIRMERTIIRDTEIQD